MSIYAAVYTFVAEACRGRKEIFHLVLTFSFAVSDAWLMLYLLSERKQQMQGDSCFV